MSNERPTSDLASSPSTKATVAVPIAERRDVPQIEVLKENDIVRSIRISCPCGNSVDIQCQYPE